MPGTRSQFLGLVTGALALVGSRQEAYVTQTFEYKFIRLGEGFLGARKEAKQTYQDVVHQHAREGWRLVQIFAPGTGAYGVAKYFEVVLERPRQ